MQRERRIKEEKGMSEQEKSGREGGVRRGWRVRKLNNRVKRQNTSTRKQNEGY